MTYNISNLNLTQWSQLVQSNAPIYVNDNQIRVFDTPQEAQAQGFSRMSLMKIISISGEIMRSEPKNSQLIESLENLLAKKIEHLKDTTLKKLCRGILAKEHESLFAKAEQMSAIAPVNLVTPELSHMVMEQIGVADRLFRSRDGRFGVFYLQNPLIEDAVIFKFPADPTKHIVADRYYKKLGYSTPEYSAIHWDTAEGRAVRQCLENLLDTLQRGGNTQDQSAEELEEQKQSLRLQLNSPYCTVMKTVDGMSLRQVALDEGPELLGDENFMQSIGKILFYDAVIGNGDRLLVSCNLGNIILVEDGSGERKLALIDHDYKLNSNTDYNLNLNTVKSLLKGGGIINELVSRLKEAYDAPELDNETLHNQILAGVRIAKDNFTQTFAGSSFEDIFLFPPSVSIRPMHGDSTYFARIRDNISRM